MTYTSPSKHHYTKRYEGPPPNITDSIKESEQMILGQILWDPELLHSARKKLTPDSFRYERHKILFRAMIHLSEKGIGIDILNLWEYLNGNGELEKMGGSSYLTYFPLVVISEQIKKDSEETDKILAYIYPQGVAENG